MRRYVQIFNTGKAFGGYEYRAASNGMQVRIQERGPIRREWRTKRMVTNEEWEAFATANDLVGKGAEDPAPLARLANCSDS